MRILGVSCYFHDAAAALLEDGRLVAAAEEERFTRRKHDAEYPHRAIDFCLQEARIKPGELDYVAFYERPLLKVERIIEASRQMAPRSRQAFQRSLKYWKDRIGIRQKLSRHLRLSPDRILFVEHHLSHAASAFCCSPFEESAVVTIDGVGEWATTTLGKGGPGRLDLLEEIRFPHSLGLFYSALTAFLGFEVNEGEYKVMGMAPYGEPRYLDKLGKILRTYPDGSFWLDLDYFSFHYSDSQMFSPRLVSLFGPPRVKDAPFVTRLTDPEFGGPEEVIRQNQFYADLAASVQRLTEDVVLNLAREAHRRTGSTNLCLAGGVALNSVANGRILTETPIKSLYIQPAAGDSGGALGAALYVDRILLGGKHRFVMEHAYWGQQYSPDTVKSAVEEVGLKHTWFNDEGLLLEQVVDGLVAGRVVGWYEGRFEWGPRALGHRSILADPRRTEMKDIVNRMIKFREPFRPFAPVVLEEAAPQYFPGHQHEAFPARFMLMVLPMNDKAAEEIPAVCHQGTGRLQTVRPEWNGRYHSLVAAFGQATGVPVLMNTSFNLRGEPIVTTPREALSTFQRSGMDLLVLGDCLVFKS